MPLQFFAVAVTVKWLNAGLRFWMSWAWGASREGTLLTISIWEPNLTKCFVSTLDTHFWCIFFLLIKGVLDLSQRLAYTWSYPRIITVEKVAWINSMGTPFSRRSYLEYQHIAPSSLFLESLVWEEKLLPLYPGYWLRRKIEYCHIAWHLWGFKILHLLH